MYAEGLICTPVLQHMEKISMLAFHPVKMQGCYEKVEQLSLEGLQQRFDVTSPSVFVQRAQILMREVSVCKTLPLSIHTANLPACSNLQQFFVERNALGM